MQKNSLKAIHFCHAGRNSMLREAADVWWPHIHREIVEKAQKCSEHLKAGKKLKRYKSQKAFGKKPEAKEPNEEIALGFAGPFQKAVKQKIYSLVSEISSFWLNI